MARFPQKPGERGSLKWIQQAINQSPRAIDELILAFLPNARSVVWLSPLASDELAEYRDTAFLERIGAGNLAGALAEFWPARGPQWDALGKADGQILLIEAKAHISELCSSPSGASEKSLQQINQALAETAAFLGASPQVRWDKVFYQLANRLAHLYFLRKNGIPAWLVLANFVGDKDMDGPATEAEWQAAYQIVWHVLGLRERHPLAKHVIDIYPSVPA